MTLVRCSHVLMITNTHTHLCFRTKGDILGNIHSPAGSVILTLPSCWYFSLVCDDMSGTCSMEALPQLTRVSCRYPVAEATVRSQFSACELCGGQSGAGTGFSLNTSVSAISVFPPLLHIHLFIYHPRRIMFFCQYFSFPCQYHSTIAPYSFIHLPPTPYNVFLPVLQFPLSVSFHQCSILIHSSTTHAV